MVQFPGLTNAWTMPIRTRIDMLATGIKTPVGVKLMGEDLEQLAALGAEIEAILRTHPDTQSVYSERVTGGHYIDISVRREDAARFGLTVEDVQDVVRSAIGGMNVTWTVEGLERYPVNVRFPRDLRGDLQALEAVALVPDWLADDLAINLGRVGDELQDELARLVAVRVVEDLTELELIRLLAADDLPEALLAGLGVDPVVEHGRHALADLDQAAQLADVLQVLPQRDEQTVLKLRRAELAAQPSDQRIQPILAHVDGVRDHEVSALDLDVHRREAQGDGCLLRR